MCVYIQGAWLQLLRIKADDSGPLETLFEQHVSGTISDIAKVSCSWTSNVQLQPASQPSKLPYTCSPIAHTPIVSNDVLVVTSDQGSLVFLAVVVPTGGDLIDNGRFELVAEVVEQMSIPFFSSSYANCQLVGTAGHARKRLYKGWKKDCCGSNVRKIDTLSLALPLMLCSCSPLYLGQGPLLWLRFRITLTFLS